MLFVRKRQKVTVRENSDFHLNCIELTDARKPQALEGTAKYTL